MPVRSRQAASMSAGERAAAPAQCCVQSNFPASRFSSFHCSAGTLPCKDRKYQVSAKHGRLSGSDLVRASDFQAEYEGLIPFTRSNKIKYMPHTRPLTCSILPLATAAVSVVVEILRDDEGGQQTRQSSSPRSCACSQSGPSANNSPNRWPT
jgi:hypothetical protein